MLRKLVNRLSYANVVATMALFVALGGSAYAVNTVRSTDIVDGEVKSVDIANQSITSADVQDGAINTYDVANILGVDLVDGTLTGADIANDSIGAADIGSGQVGADEVLNDSLLQSDIRAGAVTGDEVLDGSLNDEDIAQDTYHFEANIGTIPAHRCGTPAVAGVPARGDHLILTPDWTTAFTQLSYTAEYRSDADQVIIKVCNPTTAPIFDGLTTFNLLVIDGN
jgi:hypothetical protein